jgi:carboxymethylenebutenolidase
MCDLHGCGRHRAMPPIIVPDAERRAFLKGLASLPLAAVLFDPLLARAQASTLEMIEIEVDGTDPVRGAVALPAADTAPAVVLIHEWWGLNDQIKAVAAELARLGFVAFAIDLFDSEPAAEPDIAMQLVQNLDPDVANNKLVAAIDWLAAHERGTGKVATVGWCFGGGWSLDASLATPVDATVIYYGNVEKTAAQLETLYGPVLGHFATQDQFITRDMVQRFETAMAEAGKSQFLTVYWYDADHAFANPSGARYDASDAKLAWDRTIEFLRAALA